MRPLVAVAVVATAVIAPMWFFGDASGHDFQYHVASWVEVVRQWHEGILFPRWAEWANWGYGDPRFIFYPPASRIIGAALGLAFPWRAVASAYIWVALVGSGMSMWTLAREWLPGNAAAAAAIFFAANPYSLVLVYYRSDFAELLTVALFPVLILAVVRIARHGWRELPLFAAIFAAVWMCDAPGAVIATYSTVLLFVVSYGAMRDRRILLRGAVAMICGFGLAAFYILPAAREENWANLGAAVQGGYRFSRSFLFSGAGDPDFRLFNARISAIALGLILACIVLALLSRQRGDVHSPRWMLLALAGGSAFMMLRPSAVLWRLLPEMRFVQFPWRWLDALVPVFAFFAAAACTGWRRQRVIWSCVLALVAVTGVAIARTAFWDSDSARDVALWMQWGVGYAGTDELAPRGSDRYALYGVNPDAEQPPQDTIAVATEFDPESTMLSPLNGVRVHVERWTAERRILSERSTRPVDLAMRLLAYPAWEARVDGVRATIQATPTGTTWLYLSPGEHQIDLSFRVTWDRAAGIAISLGFAILLCLCAWVAASRSPARER